MGDKNQQSLENAIDIVLVNRVLQGEKKAFDLLVLKYQQRIAKVLYSYVKDQDEVYDVVQEAFIKAYRNLSSFKGDSAFYSWLYRIAVNTAKNYLTARNRRPPRQDLDYSDAHHLDTGGVLEDNNSPDNLLMNRQLHEKIQKSMDKLPTELKQAISLRENEGLNYDEIAGKMGCPIGTVRSRIFRARQLLIDDLGSSL